MANNLVTENYLRLNFSPKAGIIPTTEDHNILKCTEILTRYSVTISPSTGNYCPKQSELTALSIPTAFITSLYSPPQNRNSVNFTGGVTSDGGSTIIQRGYCYTSNSVGSIPDITNTKLIISGTTGAMNGSAYFYPSRIYNVRAFATNALGTAYSPTMEVITTHPEYATTGTYYTHSNCPLSLPYNTTHIIKLGLVALPDLSFGKGYSYTELPWKNLQITAFSSPTVGGIPLYKLYSNNVQITTFPATYYIYPLSDGNDSFLFRLKYTDYSGETCAKTPSTVSYCHISFSISDTRDVYGAIESIDVANCKP
jgi:hypothetical protein